MPKYITVNQFRVGDTGIVGTAANAGITDLSLARAIADAEGDIDAFMEFPWWLSGGFEPHMSGLVQAAFDSYSRKLIMPSTPVPVRNAQRYRVHISNSSPSGQGLFASINTGDVVLAQGEGYIEVVPLNAILWSFAATTWDLGLEPPIVEADFELGYYVPHIGAPLYNDSGDLKAYRAIDAFWASTYTQAIANQPNTLPPVPPVVYKNGAVQGSGLYTVNYTEGVVTFGSALTGSDIVTADYTAVIPDFVRVAAIAQTTWRLAIRNVAQMGALPYDLVRSGEQQVRRKEANALGNSSLCTEAYHALKSFKSVPIA